MRERLEHYAICALFVLGRAMVYVMLAISAPLWVPLAALVVYASYEDDETPWDEKTP